MPLAALQAGAPAAASTSWARRIQQGSGQQPHRRPTVAAASRRSPSQPARMWRQPAAAATGRADAEPDGSPVAFGSVDYVEPAEAAAAVGAASADALAGAGHLNPAAAAAASAGGSRAAAASQPAPRPPSSLRSEDVALGIVSSEEEEEEAEEDEESEVDSLKQEVSELRQLLIAQARLVQAQQRMIHQMEAAVGKAVVQSTTAVTAAEAATEAVHREGGGAFSRDGAPQASCSFEGVGLLDAAPGSGYLPEGSSAGAAGAAAAATAGPGAGAPPAPMISRVKEEAARHDAAVAGAALHDRRLVGLYDARYHSTSWGATPRDYRILPSRIFLVRHAESEGNVDNIAYTYLPDPRVPLTARGWQQAMGAGDRLRTYMDAASGGKPYKLYFYTSPYLRSRQTYEGLAQAFDPEQVQGVQEEVQLREQDFGNFQDAEGKKREKAERLRFGRFFYRFPNGESGADVYDRMTIFEDHLVRDINAGRFADNTSLVLVTHGLALRIFLMRWFHWTVDQFMDVFNPPNAEPLVLERVPTDTEAWQGGPASWIHTKALYRLSDSSREIIKGCTPDMCQTSWAPRGINPLDPADSLLLPAGATGGPSGGGLSASSTAAAAAAVAAAASAVGGAGSGDGVPVAAPAAATEAEQV